MFEQTLTPAPNSRPKQWQLFIAAHTNVGKTALLRTLLGQDVGEVHDAPNVTQGVNAHELARDAQGQTLSLWDTPGFGDSFRLAQRLRQPTAWLRWLLREFRDRWRTPALWRAQRLAHTLRTQADVVLYPVSMLETPSDALYVVPEMEVLAWVGKPVVVILNQGGALSDEAQRVTRAQQWREALEGHAVVRSVIDLDAFSRCWLQELTLFEEIGQALPEAEQPGYQSLTLQLQQAHVRRFNDSVKALTECLIKMARDRCELAPAHASGGGLTGTLKRLWRDLSWHKEGPHGPAAQASADLDQRHAQRTQNLATRLIALHCLDGVGAAIASGCNMVTHQDKEVIRWDRCALEETLKEAVVLYLGVAHFGRGQGPWQQQAATDRWLAALGHTLQAQRPTLHALWAEPDAVLTTPDAQARLQAVLDAVLRGVLLQLYPDKHAVLAPHLALGTSPAAGTMPGDAQLRHD